MAAPVIPPIRLGLIGTGLAVEKLHWPALRGLADRYEVARDALTAGKDVFCEKPTSVDADQAASFLALAAGHPDRTFVVGENFFYRDDLRYAHALLDGGAIGRPHLMAWRHVGRLVPREGRFTGTRQRQRPRYRGGVHHIAQIRLLRGDIARVHGAAANSTIEAPSDLALNLVFTGGAIGNYTASYPEIPVPEPHDMRLYGTEGVLAGSSSERRVTHSSSDATTHTTVFRGSDNGYRAELVSRAGNQAPNSPAQLPAGGVAGRAQVRSSTRATRRLASENPDPPTYAPHFRRETLVDFADAVRFGPRPAGSVAQSVADAMVVQRTLDSAERAAELALDPVPGAGPVPLWRPRGSTGLFDGLPGQHISSSATFVA
jgi:predicted dehydrogenase